MRQPREFTCFSYDEQRALRHDDSSLGYLYLLKEDLATQNGYNLSEGYDRFIQRDAGVDEHLDGLLVALTKYEKEHGGRKTAGDIVTWRGMLTKLMCLPFEKDGDSTFEMNITYFDVSCKCGVVLKSKEYKSSHDEPEDDRRQLMSYWGYKFEQIATIPKPWGECTRDEIEKRTHKPVNNNVQYCSIIKSGLGSVRMIVGGEVDCAKDYKPDEQRDNPDNDAELFDNPLDHYVELKTNQVINHDTGARNFEKKLLRVWAQSFLLGVPKAIVGFRTREGYLQTFEEFEVQKIPAMIKKSKFYHPRNSWDGNEAIAFLAACLQWIKTSIPAEENGEVWKLRYIARSDYLLLMKAPGQASFLHPDFVEWRKERRESK
ncbi:putative Dhp1-interacting protein Din1 [Myxozyma melibiosi]|uniref:Decapping nuclease n=1 Tax=Myxozyma melibiosi TaxID=54550 RepID=A0ABR1FD66_9ASCO